MGPPQRKRFNEKARQSVAGGSSHKKRRHSHKAAGGVDTEDGILDANRETIVPDSKEELEWRAREKQRRELLAGSSSEDPSQKLSSKKKKRLDSYIASRLKKEARTELLKELAESTDRIREGRIDLASARNLGTGKVSSNRELIDGKYKSKLQDDYIDEDSEDDDEDASSQAGPSRLPREGNNAPVGELLDDEDRRRRIMEAASAFEPSATSSYLSQGSEAASRQTPAPAVSNAPEPMSRLAFGSALALGADGQPIAPIIRKRKRKGLSQTARRQQRARASSKSESEDSSEESEFDSSESSGDDQGDFSEGSADSDEDAVLEEAMRRRGVQMSSSKGVTQSEHSEAARTSGSASDRDTDSEEEAVFLEAMRRRGLELPSEDEEDSEDANETSDRETDSDEEVVLMEAMRRRGMEMPSEDERDDEDEDEQEIEAVNQRSPKSPTWDGFVTEQDEDVSVNGSETSEQEETDTDEGQQAHSSSHDDDTEADAEPRSRRRGIQSGNRSTGFKDWARTALGFGGDVDAEGVSTGGRTAEGAPLEPVAGLSVRVKDIGPDDGVARGPLGRDEPAPAEQSAFAAKYYSEIASSKALQHVPVKRTPEIVESRLKLPVVQDEERLMRTIAENEVTVVCGETGSGKTTQVPQMLYERGFGTPSSDNPGLVGITQPRRVAAVSTARRVADELNLPSNKVSHQIRYDGTVSPQTSVKFMTDGVLLRELASDLLLTRYSVVIVDEAHERSINTDVLIGMLSRVVRLRATRWLENVPDARPLRLVIMSATLRVSDFVDNTTLFAKAPPMIKIEARQHPVSVHFNRKTPHDYMEESIKKASKIHTRLPPGGILIFLTGEQEIRTVCKRLEAKFGAKALQNRSDRSKFRRNGSRSSGVRDENDDEDRTPHVRVRPGREDVEAEDMTLGTTEEASDVLEEDIEGPSSPVEDDEALDTDEEAEDGDENENAAARAAAEELSAPMHILPLYSLLPSERQLEVFKPPPEGSRLVVVATNVAETSLTIPNMRYVIDSGRAKERKYSGPSGISSFRVDWISQASAAQRAGRAGRTGPGHCYRLYSSNVFEEFFDKFAEAEIRRAPVEGLVLQMKSMNIDNVVNFPFPTPPDRQDIAKAERMLTRLGALQMVSDPKRPKEIARITELGRVMALFPLGPRFAKMLVQGQQQASVLPYIATVVAALSVGDLFVKDEAAAEDDEGEDNGMDAYAHFDSEAERQKAERKDRRRRRFAALARFDALGGTGVSDAFRSLAAFGAYSFAGYTVDFCTENFLRPKAMEEVRLLRGQLISLITSTLDLPSSATTLLQTSSLPPPSATDLKILRQLLTSSSIDCVAIRADLAPTAARLVPELAEQALSGRLRGDKWKTCRRVPYLAMGVQGEATYLHPSSALYEHAPPEWVVFQEVSRSRPKDTRRGQSDPGSTDAAASDIKLGDSFEERADRGRVYLQGLTRINPSWLPRLAKDMCSFSKAIPIPLPDAAATTTSSKRASSREQEQEKGDMVVVTPTYGLGPACEPGQRATGVGWELPAVKARRRWVGGREGWRIDLV